MDKRTMLAILLSMLVIIGYTFLFPTPQQAPQQETPHETPKAGNIAPAQPVAAVPAPSQLKEIRVENELYTAVLTSRGGTIKSWAIKEYKDAGGNDVPLLAKPGVLPALAIGGDTSFALASANFSVIGGDLKLDSANPSGTVIFEFAGEGVSVRRTFTFNANTYRMDVADEVSGLPSYWIALGSDFGIFETDAEFIHVGPVLLSGTDLVELAPKKLKEPKNYRENVMWIAQEDKYFFAGLVPQTPVQEAKAWTADGTPAIALQANPGTNRFILYAGPKEHDRLKALNLGLEHIIDFGFFSVIARPLFWVLKFFYGFFGNYGLAIILLTIVTRLPFIPLLSKSQKSMKKLSELQPKMAEIKEKHKKDPQRMQKEMTELYRKYKVNPVSGCLPMLLQIPVFFALYKVLLIAIELRGAPFMLWITDLSAKDPFYILPIVMGITMVIQQKMTPSTMDPRQAKLMMLMPVVFTFLFLNFASGLVLYWLVNNVLAIIQQFFINRQTAQQPAE